jgi:hypothetical protein
MKARRAVLAQLWLMREAAGVEAFCFFLLFGGVGPMGWVVLALVVGGEGGEGAAEAVEGDDAADEESGHGYGVVKRVFTSRGGGRREFMDLLRVEHGLSVDLSGVDGLV